MPRIAHLVITTKLRQTPPATALPLMSSETQDKNRFVVERK
jgi:hypothetical protein